jgi:hypothetical protein
MISKFSFAGYLSFGSLKCLAYKNKFKGVYRIGSSGFTKLSDLNGIF